MKGVDNGGDNRRVRQSTGLALEQLPNCVTTSGKRLFLSFRSPFPASSGFPIVLDIPANQLPGVGFEPIADAVFEFAVQRMPHKVAEVVQYNFFVDFLRHCHVSRLPVGTADYQT